MIPTPFEMVPRWSLALVLLVFSTALMTGGTAAQAQRPTPRAEEDFATGVQLYNQKLYHDAAAALHAFRRQHPDHPQVPEALFLEARSALSVGRDKDAARLLDSLGDAYPSHPQGAEARLRLAQYFFDQGDAKSAQTQLASVIQSASGARKARALYLRGLQSRQQGDLKAALRDFEQVLASAPDSEVAPTALYALGATQLELNRYDAAAQSLETLAQRYPEAEASQNLGTALGDIYYRLGEYERAAQALDGRVDSLEGNQRARAHLLLGASYAQLGRGAKAEAQYRAVLDDPASAAYAAAARFGLAWRLYQDERFDPAAANFARVRQDNDSALANRAVYYEAAARAQAGALDRALELYQMVPDRLGGRLAAEAQYESGLLLYRQERYAAAAEAFRAVLRDYPNAARRGDAAYWLGNAQLATGKLDAALQAYKQAARRGAAPDSLLQEVQFRRGWTLYSDGQYGDAASAFLSLAEAQPRSSRGADALFWAADSYYNLDRFGRARQLLQRYLDAYPDGRHRPEARYTLGWAALKQERYESAARHFRQFIDASETDSSVEPYRQDARLRLGDAYYALKRYDDAVRAYRQVEGEGADYATYQSGEALNYAGRPADAIRVLEQFAEQYPSSDWRPEALYRLGTIHFQQQNYTAAREAYRRFLDSYPDHGLAPQAQYSVGDSYYNAGAMTDAVDAYRKVLETYPESETATEAASSLFFALSAAGQSDRADEIIASIAEANPDANLRERLRFSRAQAAYQRGDSEQALRLFREFVRTASSDSLLPGAYYYLGLLYADQEAQTEAVNYLQQLVDRYPESQYRAEGALRLGDIYLDQGEFEEAADAYRAAAQSPQISNQIRAQARYGEGVSLLRLGRNDEAESLLTGLLEEERQGPIQALAQLGLARISEAEGRTQKAIDLYRSVVRASEGEAGAEALYRLGRLLRRQGQLQTAVRELDRMSSLYAGYPEWVARSLLEQARAYESLGQTGQAAQLYDQVVQSYPGTPFADTARSARTAL